MTAISLPIAVIGAGPVGLAAAAELIARGETPLVLEAGPRVGASVREWAHVRMFSPWEYNVSPAARLLLARAGWQMPDAAHHPTGAELVRDYLEPLAALPAMAASLRLSERVTGIARRGMDKVQSAGRDKRPFILRTLDAQGAEHEYEVRAVIDASGTWTRPNPMGAAGFAALGETAVGDLIAHGIPDVLGPARGDYAGRRVAVVGSGHSAINALIDLCALADEVPGTQAVWVLRKAEVGAAFGGGDADQLAARGELGQRIRALVEAGQVELATGFRIVRAQRSAGRLLLTAEDGRQLAADRAIVATGFRPDLALAAELRLDLDPALECPAALGPMIDPNLHSCGTVRPHGFAELAHPERGYFIVGMKSYGRAPTFLLATGHEQVRSIAAHLCGDHAAAGRVELKLPETGVCKAPVVAAASAGTCCGATPKLAVAKAGVGCC